MAIVFCKNCGGDFDASEPKCPFCGYINYSGAEKKYMDDLGKIRENLDDVDDAVVRDNKKMVKKYGIIIGCVAVVVVLVILLVVLISKWNEERIWGDRVDPKEQLLWENENFPKLEAWFDEGNYAAILDFENQMYLEESPYNLYGFEHFGEFISQNGTLYVFGKTEELQVIADKCNLSISSSYPLHTEYLFNIANTFAANFLYKTLNPHVS